ncbi:MAG: hypothetical protein U0270_05690 [Labilithrix sp.]
MIKRDYLERLLEEMAQLANRVIGRAAEHPTETRREIDAAYSQVGVPTLVLDRLDPASIRMMSGDKVGALVKLLETDAEVSELLGDAPRARRRRALAHALAETGIS